MSFKKKVLVLYDPPPPYGGVRVSAEALYGDLKSLSTLDLEHFLYESDSRNMIFSIIAFVKSVLRNDIIFFMVGDVLTLNQKRASIYYLIATLLGKEVAFKGFAGGLEKQIRELPSDQQRKLKKKLNKLKLLTVQTKSDYRFFREILTNSQNIKWLPNTRPFIEGELALVDKTQAKKICFIGKVWKPKGVHLILEAAKKLPKEIQIDLYGPLNENDPPALAIDTNALNVSNVKYRGVLKRGEIKEKIKEYDSLLLPSTWKTEGHPGVILEALSMGVPVIATNWNGIPEIIDKSVGILITPDSVEELINAILYLYDNTSIWNDMRQNAPLKAKEFDSLTWATILNKWLLELR